jgi:hypothetical protein
MSTNGKRNRNAGFSWEREIAATLREIGFPNAVTSRSESRSRDDQKVDIINKDEAKNGRLPYNIQAKCAKGHLKYAALLSELPNDPGIINTIFHKQTTKNAGGRFMETGRFVILNMDDFLLMVKELENLRRI